LSNGALSLSGNITSLSLASSVTGATFRIVGTKLASLSVPVLAVDDLVIGSNPFLTSLGGGGGRIRKQISIQSNPRLSTQAARTWVDTFDHTGAAVTITGNQVP
jgi:hypothetical protein